MIDKNEVIAFFDTKAAVWDAEMIRSDEKIGRILDNAHVGAGSRVLDVACGTGVLMPDYLARNVGSVTAIDISPEMIRIASEKFPQENLCFVCGDVETADVGADFDAIVVYNAFPHFPDGARLIKRLSSLLREGGTLTVAHGMSREDIDGHHHGAASHVSNGLMRVTDLASIFERTLEVTTVISDENMYQVVGKKVSVLPHDHGHGEHSHDTQAFPTQALLAHTVMHNRSHMDELRELAAHVKGDAQTELYSAIDLMQTQNTHLEKALALLQNQE